MSTELASGATLDASALLAMLQSEPGGEIVEKQISRAAISAVNWSEVIQKANERGLATEGLRSALEALGLQVIDFSAEQAECTARLRAATRFLGLSLADRACLALALERGEPAFTTDRAWGDLSVGVEIQMLR